MRSVAALFMHAFALRRGAAWLAVACWLGLHGASLQMGLAVTLPKTHLPAPPRPPGSDPANGTEKKMGSFLMMTCFLCTTISSGVQAPVPGREHGLFLAGNMACAWRGA